MISASAMPVSAEKAASVAPTDEMATTQMSL